MKVRDDAVRTGGGVVKEQMLGAREGNRFGRVEGVVLALYSAVLVWMIPRHEAWADEAQAWMLVQAASAKEIFFGHLLGYEGSPGLWHALLMVLARMHVSYAGMHWFSGAVGALGIWVLLRWSPFPLLVRVLLPFTFFLQYQYAVVARSYVLFPVLAFGLCAVVRSERARPVVFALLAGLMANVSLHGAVFSLGMAYVYWRRAKDLGWYRTAEGVGGAGKMRGDEISGRRWVAAGVLLAVGWMAVPAVAWLPPDHSFVSGLLNKPAVQRLMKHKAGLPEDTEPKWAEVLEQQKKERELQAQGKTTGEVSAKKSGAAAKMKERVRPVMEMVLQAGTLMMYPVSNFNLVAVAFWVLVVRWVRWRRAWRVMLPWLMIFLLCMAVRVAEYHTGMLWIALVCALWLTWPNPEEYKRIASGREAGEFRVLGMVTCLVLLVQVGWTVSAVIADSRGAYSGEAALAQFLAPRLAGNGGGDRVDGFHYQTIGANAFFGRSIFANQPTPYWQWPIRKVVDRYAPEALEKHPRYVVIALVGPGEDSMRNQFRHRADLAEDGWVDTYNLMDLAKEYGYRETHRFCGTMRMRFRASEIQCEVVMEPEGSGAVAGGR